MTFEQLEKAEKVKKELNEIETVINVLNNPYMNHISGHSFVGDKETRHAFYIQVDLKELIIKYYEDKLNVLEKEFESI